MSTSTHFMHGLQQRTEWGKCFELKGLIFGDKPREKAIGRRAASVKCRMDVTEREGHIWRSTSASSKFGRSCPGDPCSDG
ncbi:uncharacterized protein N7458_012059 [Penicillium daleae]|uniref:Uncharacterized protein n=1 Tax=Penicillium daleae TaxID=63821 RepID=A0AAD6BV62_9EURO|nr:uncharacterized protein N7458_012059 [Penicillium daleae]KAJ5432903.1 hypothetical protein N7458_012059 [Penicillium daleae]